MTTKQKIEKILGIEAGERNGFNMQKAKNQLDQLYNLIQEERKEERVDTFMEIHKDYDRLRLEAMSSMVEILREKILKSPQNEEYVLKVVDDFVEETKRQIEHIKN